MEGTSDIIGLSRRPMTIQVLPSIRDMLNGALPKPSFPAQTSSLVTAINNTTSLSRVPSFDRLESGPSWRHFHSDQSDSFTSTSSPRQLSSPGFRSSGSPDWTEINRSDASKHTSFHRQRQSPGLSVITSTPVSSGPSLECFGLQDILQDLSAHAAPESPDMGAIRRLVSEHLDNTLRPAHNQGWYRPTNASNNFRTKLEDRIQDLSMNELVSAYFTRDLQRATYGDRVIIPRRSTEKNAKSESPGQEPAVPLLNIDTQKKKETHAALEQKRRERHRDFQNQSDLRSPDVAAACGVEHADASKEAKSQRAKGPGKDEQLCTAIYAQELSGRVVQSEHDGRERAERTVCLLLDLLEVVLQQRRSDLSSGQQYSVSNHSRVSEASYAGRKRTQDEAMSEETRSPQGKVEDTESGSDYGQSLLASSSPLKRHRSAYHFQGSLSILQSLPPSPTPSSEDGQPPALTDTKMRRNNTMSP